MNREWPPRQIDGYSTFRKRVRSVEDAPDKRPKPKDAKPGRPQGKETGWRITVV